MKTKKAQNWLDGKIVALVLVSIISIVALLASFYAIHRISLIEKDGTDAQIQLNSSDSRLLFCHDNQVIPCDDDAIEQWNEANPQDRYNL